MSDIQWYLEDLDNLIDTGHFKEDDVSDYVGINHKGFTLRDFISHGRELIRCCSVEHIKAMEAKDKQNRLDMADCLIKELKPKQQTIAEQAKEIERMKQLCSYSCGAWADVHKWAYKHFDVENCEDYPMVPGIKLQNALKTIGKNKWESKTVGSAIESLPK